MGRSPAINNLIKYFSFFFKNEKTRYFLKVFRLGEYNSKNNQKRNKIRTEK